MAQKPVPIIENNYLRLENGPIEVGSAEWFVWLEKNKKFKYQGETGHFLARGEKRRNDAIYWYAYRRKSKKLSKIYLGKAVGLTSERLEEVCRELSDVPAVKPQTLPKQRTYTSTEPRIDNSFLPQTKVNAPILPQRLLSRPRLTQQLDLPLTLIYAPSGFGKSTLINEWKQNCGFPVAWLILDKTDNQPLRFLYSLVLSLQTIDPNLGQNLYNYLRISSSSFAINEAISLLSHDIAQLENLGIVLDDFHHITNSKIFDFLQAWLEQFPPNLRLILSGHSKPPLALGNLRAMWMVTEIDSSSLRFTTEEGINYLRKYPQDPPLAHNDIEKLVRHTEGWAVGLTLTALALAKQEDQHQFVENFSGAHIYFREYFMETVLYRLSSAVKDFLLKTSIVRQLTGSLCDALTGQSNGKEMLSQLWEENLFLMRLREPDWYRYHDLFAEMLNDQLRAQYPEQIPMLHRKAAKWFDAHFAPADAISHFLAARAWEDAAILIEETALREMELFGEDSRLLSWLFELPENVVQQHKTLLIVYIQVANLALPKSKIESFIGHVETNIAQKAPAKQTRGEREVLEEIQRIRSIWAQGLDYHPTMPSGTQRELSWQLLNGLHLLKDPIGQNTVELEQKILQYYESAKELNNLFVILMAGGVYAHRTSNTGKLRAGEKIAHQVLQHAISLRGTLPETASIALVSLSRIHFERCELEQSAYFLAQAAEVDPNPTSTNSPVNAAVLRSKIQLAENQIEAALSTIRAVQELHARRPSASWRDSDLIAYEARIHLRTGNLIRAEQLLNTASEMEYRPLCDLITAEFLLATGKPEEAEQILHPLIVEYPLSIQQESTTVAKVLLSLALFDQHKMNQSRQVMADAIRLSAADHHLCPFIEHGTRTLPMLIVILQTENLTELAKDFINEIIAIFEEKFDDSEKIAEEEVLSLSTAASITTREQGVLELLSDGQSNKQIALSLSISESTVKTHLTNIYEKLDVNNRVQAVSRAKELQLI